MTKLSLLYALTALSIIPSIASAATTADFAPGPGETASAGTWTRVFTVTTSAAGNAASKGAQTVEMNVTSGQFGAMQYRTVKMNKNQTSYQYGNATTMLFGSNTITVGAVTNAEFLNDPDLGRTVKVQFRNDNIGFDSLTVNGVNANPDEVEGSPFLGQSLSASDNFDAGPNTTWQALLPLTTVADGVASQGEQTAVINVTYIPEGGATWRTNKTVANGNYSSGNTETLVIGENTISVTAVAFDRTVKVQFSSDAVEFDALTFNGVDQLVTDGTQGVGNPISDYENIFAPANATVAAQGWVSVATLTTAADGVASQGVQTVVINVTYIPLGGATYRINRTVANGNYNSDDAVGLVLGENTITVDAVDYDRAVKLQFSSDAFEFDALIINGEDMLDDSGDKVTIANSNLFNAGPDANWVSVITTAVSQDGASSQNEQTVVLNVTTLPGAGANYRVVKTVSNGTWYAGNSQALSLGPNTITVNSVAFDRSVKIQFSSDAVEYNALSVNGTDRVIGADEVVVPSLSIDGNTLSWTQTDGTTLQFSDDLESWTSLPSATSPYSPSTTPDRFYRTISEEE